MLGLRFCARAFSSCGRRGPLFIAVRGPLTITASLVAEHRLQTRRLSNCGSRAQLLHGMWDPPRPGLEPASPALAGRFSTAVPPGKPTRPNKWRQNRQPTWKRIQNNDSKDDPKSRVEKIEEMFNKDLEELKNKRASLVVQWLRMRLPMQVTGIRSLVQEDPTCRGATKPTGHNYWSLCA